ncbi:ABC transporter permease [Actinomadura sp. NBRC 104412]|uniref:ABC transporter permease n=1 Tax=Actinomadura sp. NBRC 104412 TaxID=3032203 RepID=UPI0024A0654D|nr:ABC transporter permease [Actinomadura sp. NBRC 104412]GLZ07527.1 ABC transporter permease [Actinomadura sp. NBRC 104412]
MITVPVLDQVAAAGPSRRRNRYLAGLLSARGLTGLSLVALITLAGVIGPLLLPYGPLEQGPDALAPPGGEHPLGTDEVGRDILARVLGGIRVDLLLALVAVPIAVVLGTGLGMLSVVNRLAGGAVQRFIDVLLGFPGVVLGVAIGIAMTPGFNAVWVTIVLVALPAFGRQARMATLGQLSRDYVSAARVLGTPRARIVVGHMLPNICDAVLVRAAVAVAQAIQIEGGLSVVGLGIQPPSPSLGSMIAGGSQYLSVSPMYSLASVIVVFVLVLGCTLIADALNKAVLRR